MTYPVDGETGLYPCLCLAHAMKEIIRHAIQEVTRKGNLGRLGSRLTIFPKL